MRTETCLSLVRVPLSGHDQVNQAGKQRRMYVCNTVATLSKVLWLLWQVPKASVGAA